MTLTLRAYPEELLSYLTGPKYDESRIFPEMDIPDRILEDIQAIIDEILLCCFKTKEYDINKLSTIKFPLDPKGYYSQINNIIDPNKFSWYSYWMKWESKNNINDRRIAIEFLEKNKIIAVDYSPPITIDLKKYFLITFNDYPQLEAINDLKYEIDEFLVMISREEQDQEREKEKSYIVRNIEKQIQKARIEQASITYWIDFKISGEIVLNNKYVIAKPHLDTENDLVCEYIMKKPNEKITLEQIEKEIGKLQNDLSKIVYNLGFKGELRKMFFPRIGYKSIIFKNQIKNEELESLGVNTSALKKQIKALPLR